MKKASQFLGMLFIATSDGIVSLEVDKCEHSLNKVSSISCLYKYTEIEVYRWRNTVIF